jgi:hypothetical protein
MAWSRDGASFFLHMSLHTPSVKIFEIIMAIEKTTIFQFLEEFWWKTLLNNAVEKL